MELEKTKKIRRIILAVIIAVLVLFVASQSFAVIPTGYTGVRITFGQVDESVVPQGFNFKIPFVQQIARVNNKQQEITNESAIESTIIGKVPITISNIGVTYRVNSEKSSYIYKNVSDPNALVSYDLISSAVKSSTTEFDADSVVVRTTIEPVVKDKLQEKIDSKYGEGVVSVIQVTLGEISFSDEYNTAINNKNIAKQEAEQQEIVNQKNIDKANADAEALLIAAQADKEAYEIKEKAITDKILIQQYLEKWDGKLPVVAGSDGSYMIDISKLMEDSENAQASSNE